MHRVREKSGKNKFNTKESRKICHFDTVISKIFWGGAVPFFQIYPFVGCLNTGIFFSAGTV